MAFLSNKVLWKKAQTKEKTAFSFIFLYYKRTFTCKSYKACFLYFKMILYNRGLHLIDTELNALDLITERIFIIREEWL